MRYFINIDILQNSHVDIDIFKTGHIDIDMFKKCRYWYFKKCRHIDIQFGLSIYETPLSETDWAAAAERAGNRLLEINPDMLIIVEGILSAGNLMGALIHPIELSRPEKLVYSGHIYPFSPIISDLDYPLYKSLMHTMQVEITFEKNLLEKKGTGELKISSLLHNSHQYRGDAKG